MPATYRTLLIGTLTAVACACGAVGWLVLRADRGDGAPAPSATARARPESGAFRRVDFVLDQPAPPKVVKEPKKAKPRERAPAHPAEKEDAAPAPAAEAKTAPPPVVATPQPAKPVAPVAPANPPVPVQATTPPAPAGTAGGTVASSGVVIPEPYAAAVRTRLTREELEKLLPGASVMRLNLEGKESRWVNNRDGSLMAIWAPRYRQVMSATGKWRISDDGRYCLHVEWPKGTENWCRFLAPAGKDQYMPIPNEPSANLAAVRLLTIKP